MELIEAYKMVYNDLINNRGVYDAKNGNRHFMYGVHSVMETVAYMAGG